MESRKAREALDAFIAEYERTILPRANGTVALGRDYVEARYRAEELIDLPADSMLAIAQRELKVEQAQFVEKARAVDSTRDAMDVWEKKTAIRFVKRTSQKAYLEVLESNHWNRFATAEVLGINRTTLYKKMKKLGLEDGRLGVL